VALRLLEAMREEDLPHEVLEEENPAQTIPRRFGLSDVVDRQIRQLREDVKKHVRLTDEDVRGLFRFVIRRPDSATVFRRAGRLLAEMDAPPAWSKLLPQRAQVARARTRMRNTLKKLFGRPIGGTGRPPFIFEGRQLFFIDADPGGDACNLLSGFAEDVLERTLGGVARVRHTMCQGRGDELCRWEGEIVEEAPTLGTAVVGSDQGAVHAEDA
jgi:hypothetical protein